MIIKMEFLIFLTRKLLSSISVLFFVLLSTSNSNAEIEFNSQLSLAMGMVSNSFSQQPSAFDEGKTISSGSNTVISGDISYEIFTLRRKSYFFRFTGSGVAGEVSKYYSLSTGQRFYFGADGTSATFKDKNLKVTTTPLLRYYAGWNAGITSFIYTTEKEVRGDLGVEIGGHGGMLYNIDKKSSYKGELTVIKGSGVETSTINIQVFFGVSYFVKSLF